MMVLAGCIQRKIAETQSAVPMSDRTVGAGEGGAEATADHQKPHSTTEEETDGPTGLFMFRVL